MLAICPNCNRTKLVMVQKRLKPGFYMMYYFNEEGFFLDVSSPVSRILEDKPICVACGKERSDVDVSSLSFPEVRGVA